jgi:tryptophan-rich sensory protein
MSNDTQRTRLGDLLGLGAFVVLCLAGIALAEIVLLLVAIGVNALLFWRIDRMAGWLLAPYAAWVAFASILNFALWRLN